MTWNTFYAGSHWTKRKSEAERVRVIVLSGLDPDVEIYQVPVNLTVTVYFKSHPQDPDNICAKLYIDALKDRVIEDDTPRHITSVTTRSRVDRENPRVEIEIQPSV
jgi:hypothetical protein